MNKDVSVSERILRNTAFNTLGRVWGTLVAMFLMPYVVSRLGLERYGVWAFAGSVVGYFGLLDFGIGSSFVRYIAEYRARKDDRSLNELVNTGFVFYSLFGLAVLAVSCLFAGPITAFFKIPPDLVPEAVFVFLLTVFIFAGTSGISSFTAIPAGFQRMDISNILAIAVSVPTVAGIVFALEKGYGLKGIMVSNLIVFFLTAAVSFAVAFRLAPGLQFAPMRFFRKKTMSSLFDFGSRCQLARIAGMVTLQADKLLITYFIGVGMVTFFQLGSSLVMYAVSFATLMVAALMPAFTEIATLGKPRFLAEAYVRSMKYLALVAVPVFSFLVIDAPEFIFMWMGTGYAKAALVARILAVGFFLNTLAQVSASVCLAIEKPGLMARASVINIVLGFTLSFILIRSFGFAGVAWGSAIAVNIGTAYFLLALHKRLKISTRDMVRQTAPLLLAGGVASLAFAFLERFVLPMPVGLTRVAMLGVLSAKFLFFLLIYAVLVAMMGIFQGYEKEFLAGKFPFLARLLRRVLVRDGKDGMQDLR